MNNICSILSYDFMINLGILNFLIVVMFVIPRFFTFLTFGYIDDHVLRSIKERFNYTLFEFICGLVILRCYKDVGLRMCLKYGSLFVCLMLLKSFHYLCDLKVAKLDNLVRISRAVWIKNLMGILVLIGMDLSLILKFKNDIDSNSLLAIFGYEIINILPSLLFTLLKFLSMAYYDLKSKQLISAENSTYLEFSLNLVRFMLFLAYTWFFHQSFTFPIHIIPSSYTCFRLLLRKTRSLIVMKRNERIFGQLNIALIKNTNCHEAVKNSECFCLESIADGGDVRVLHCEHGFHYDCLKWWLVRSMACPVCRESVRV